MGALWGEVVNGRISPFRLLGYNLLTAPPKPLELFSGAVLASCFTSLPCPFPTDSEETLVSVRGPTLGLGMGMVGQRGVKSESQGIQS